jgi:hypothetical protein
MLANEVVAMGAGVSMNGDEKNYVTAFIPTNAT